MPRLARPTLTALTLVSLLICMATLALWVSSCYVADQWSSSSPEAARGITIADGKASFFAARRYVGTFPVTGLHHRRFGTKSVGGDFGAPVVLGGQRLHPCFDEHGGAVWWGVTLDLWKVAIAAALLPAARLVRRGRWPKVAALTITLAVPVTLFPAELCHTVSPWVWLPLVCGGIELPGRIAGARGARRRLRIRRGLCAACCYDLTANVSGVCPECGTKAGASRPPLTS